MLKQTKPKKQSFMQSRETDIVAQRPSIRSGGFTLGGPRSSVSGKASSFLKERQTKVELF